MNPSRVAVVGAGLIGAGWAARCALGGVAVTLYDPDPQAADRAAAMMDDAARAHDALLGDARPAPAPWRMAPTLAAALEGATLAIEAVPERLALKHAVYRQIEAMAPPDLPIASSTSGFRATLLQQGATNPARIFVAHPFQPVYLLPLVEIVTGEAADEEAVAGACALYERLGMKPLRVRREIDAFIADRLMEAVWREALWLVKDGVATTAEIDDAITYGFGLRWAQMGLFETFRCGGGGGGMRHFLAQFGPCLAEPWTKLTDVPDMDDALIETIASQSDAQAQGRSARELERIRDDNLIAILKALARQQGGAGWGAGAALNAWRARLGG